jgi:hypothetical protein
MLSAFRLTEGAPRWSHQLKGTIRSIEASAGVLYIGPLAGAVYAYPP